MDSSTMGCFSSQSVSPVVVFLRPTAAAMSPEYTCVDILTVVGMHLQDAAHALALALGGVEDGVAGVRSCRNRHGRRPDGRHRGSVMILKARAEKGASSSAARLVLIAVLGHRAVDGGDVGGGHISPRWRPAASARPCCGRTCRRPRDQHFWRWWPCGWRLGSVLGGASSSFQTISMISSSGRRRRPAAWSGTPRPSPSGGSPPRACPCPCRRSRRRRSSPPGR